VWNNSRITYSSGGAAGAGGGGGGGGAGVVCLWLCIWLVFFALFGGLLFWEIGAGVTYPKGHKHSLDLALSETRLVHVDTLWIQSVSGGDVEILDHTPLDMAQTVNNSVTLMKFDGKPELSVLSSWTSSVPNNITSDDYYYWSWYFYQNSTINMTWDYSLAVDVILIKSEAGYDAFVGNSDEDYAPYVELQFFYHS
jgi:hypothetical protein